MTEADQTPKTVLIVDDEKSVLMSLRRLLRREPWNLLLATSAQQGLQLLADNHVDLVMSDMRMAGMDGATFLKKVKEDYPSTVRVILTGYAERQSVTQAFTEADVYQLISKPWDDDELKEVLRGALEQDNARDQELVDLGRLLNEVEALPSLPTVYVELKQALDESESGSTDRVVEVVGKDPAIAARTLRIANSAFFGLRRQVDSIQHAIGLIGLVMLENIVLSASVFRDFEAEDIPGFSHNEFWRHSLACGMIAKVIEESRSRDRKRAEMAMLAGTLHDLGKLVFARFCHNTYAEVIADAQREELFISAREEEVLGVPHTVLGGRLADFWNMPAPIVEAIRWHNDPAGADVDPSLTAVVNVSDALVHSAGLGQSGNGRIPQIHDASKQILELDDSGLQQLEATVAERFDPDSLPV